MSHFIFRKQAQKTEVNCLRLTKLVSDRLGSETGAGGLEAQAPCLRFTEELANAAPGGPAQANPGPRGSRSEALSLVRKQNPQEQGPRRDLKECKMESKSFPALPCLHSLQSNSRHQANGREC